MIFRLYTVYNKLRKIKNKNETREKSQVSSQVLRIILLLTILIMRIFLEGFFLISFFTKSTSNEAFYKFDDLFVSFNCNCYKQRLLKKQN